MNIPSPGAASARPGAPDADRSVLVVVGSMAVTLLLLGVVLALIGAELLAPPPWMLLLVAVATLGAWALALLSPVPPGGLSDPGSGVVQPVVVMRAALVEAPALLGAVLAFTLDPYNLTIFLLPALFALAGLWLFARPSVVRARMAAGR